MKIFYVTSVLGDMGGSEIYTRDLLKELIKRGHELFVFTTCNYELKEAEMFHTKTFGHHAFHKFQGLLYIRKALKEASQFKPDLIQSHSNSLMGLIGHQIKKKLNIPHVLLIELISSHNKNLHTKTIFQIEKFLLPKLNYDKLILWTENMKRKFALSWGIPEKKIKVIPAAINTENYNLKADGTEINKKYGKHLISSIKSLWGTNAKGIEYIIKAMNYVKEVHPEYKYVIFGGGTEQTRLEKQTQEMKLNDVIEFAGYVKPEYCEKIAAATKIAPHSFVYEFSTSVSLLEFMAWGKANVVTDIGSVKEFVGDSALIVEKENEKAMAEGIIKLIENKRLRRELERKARRRVEEKYSIKATVDELEKIYGQLLKGKQK
jgi:glycosyltransferase involved in cell wall biosynthesis